MTKSKIAGLPKETGDPVFFMLKANKKYCRTINRREPANRIHGLTLMEVLVVIFLIAITSTFAVPGIMKWREAGKLRGAAENLKGDLELAKLRAIQENGAVAVQFSADGYTIFIDIDKNNSPDPPASDSVLKSITLPPGVKIDTARTSFGGSLATNFSGRGTARNGTCTMVSKGNEKKITVSTFAVITVKSI